MLPFNIIQIISGTLHIYIGKYCRFIYLLINYFNSSFHHFQLNSNLICFLFHSIRIYTLLHSELITDVKILVVLYLKMVSLH